MANIYYGGVLDAKHIEQFLNYFNSPGGDAEKMREQYGLYKGEHDILHKPQEENKPCNKLVADYHGQIIDTTVGYFLGKPIVVSMDDDGLSDEFDRIMTENAGDDLLMEVGKEAMIKGRSGVFVFQDEAGETRLVRVPAEDVLLIYDTSVSKRLRYAIRLYNTMDEENRITTHAEVYSDKDITYWVSSSAALSVGGNMSDLGAQPSSTITYIPDPEKPEAVPHIYGRVPYAVLMNNEEGMGDLEKVASLIEDYDKVVSLEADEYEAFRNAYLLIKNMTVNENTLKRLKSEGVIEVGQDGDVKFVTKTLQSDAVNKHLDRIKADIHKFAQVPDLTDEAFAGNLSGVAIRFKLFGLETKCIIKERKFAKCLLELVRILSVPMGVRTGKGVDLQEVHITFTRNIPDNLVEIVDIVSKLAGTVDKETLLSLLPFVDNPKEILDKLEEEKESIRDFAPNNDQFGDAAGGMNPNGLPVAQDGQGGVSNGESAAAQARPV